MPTTPITRTTLIVLLIKENYNGKHTFHDSFPNDALEQVEIPFGVSAALYKDDAFGGDAVVLQGENPAGNSVYNLSDYKLNKLVSCIEVMDMMQGAL